MLFYKKHILFITTYFILTGILLTAQTKEEQLNKLYLRKDIRVTEVEQDILRIEYPDGNLQYKNIGEYKQPNEQKIIYSPDYDSTIINVATLDTMLYYQKYQYWQEVPLGNFPTLLVGDINNNGKPELYGQMKNYTTDYTDILIFEMNQQNGFDSVYRYDSTLIAQAIYDIDKDGKLEMRFKRNYNDTVYNNGWGQYKFVRKSTDSSFANLFAFIFEPNYIPTQQNDFYFGDWDGDLLTDHLIIRLNNPPSINVYEYNSNKSNFDSVYQFNYSLISIYFGGFSIGDFDNDGKTEFFAGSVNGKVLSIENCGNNCYAPNWQGVVQTNNAYLCAETNDLDGNGKKEIWIGGDAYYGGVGTTRITLFETNGNNSYQAVGRIDLVGIFSWDAGNIQVVDVDKDGKEEVLLGLDQTVLILKFTGRANRQRYEVFYYRRNELELSGRNSIYHGATLYDLDGDGKEDLIINMDEVIQNVGLRLFSYIYKANYTVGIRDNKKQQPLNFSFLPLYPNPFNPKTNIKFNITINSFVSLKVYDILGNEITTLFEKELSPGSYSISWEARDGNGQLLPSGVYLFRLSARGGVDSYTKTIKTLLLK